MSGGIFFPTGSGGGGGTGDVDGPGASTDNAIVRFDGVTGKLLQNSTAILNDAGELALTATGTTTNALTITTSTTVTYLLQPNQPWQFIQIVATANTGMTLTATAS